MNENFEDVLDAEPNSEKAENRETMSNNEDEDVSFNKKKVIKNFNKKTNNKGAPKKSNISYF